MRAADGIKPRFQMPQYAAFNLRGGLVTCDKRIDMQLGFVCLFTVHCAESQSDVGCSAAIVMFTLQMMKIACAKFNC
jgi:hypothetical protein